MTDQQRLLVALLSENDDVIPADGEMSPLELMAILFDLGDNRFPGRAVPISRR